MQSSYSVIKSNSVTSGTSKKINTDYEQRDLIEDMLNNDPEEAARMVESYKNIGDNIIRNAQRQKEKMLEAAYVQAQDIEREAYERGYKQGTENGYEDGYREAYDKNIELARNEADSIISNANNILFQAKQEYEQYLEAKKEEIIRLSVEMTEKILRERLGSDNGLNSIVENVIAESKGTQTFIIKCNVIHVEAIKTQLELWKNKFVIKGEIFVIEDSSLEPGNAIVEKENGLVVVGIDISMNKLLEALS
ncbi:FliH/SctL family protein [Clostridium manihotivorum]|uniref:Flagellar biosynthesis protein n=1 Tax=Clostridium manihotivorum TaxID=2320868 RepID=A0A3R5U4W7_9CLOT|nr:FliH/SctL family protein [Clostridium manihotivorum]QAA31676.1 flagellar biosynthesis protein [Clostridium manihotivorum]